MPGVYSPSAAIRADPLCVPHPSAALRTPHAHQPANRTLRPPTTLINVAPHEALIRPSAPKLAIRSGPTYGTAPARGPQARTRLVLAGATPLRQGFTGSRGPAW